MKGGRDDSQKLRAAQREADSLLDVPTEERLKHIKFPYDSNVKVKLRGGCLHIVIHFIASKIKPFAVCIIVIIC